MASDRTAQVPERIDFPSREESHQSSSEDSSFDSTSPRYGIQDYITIMLLNQDFSEVLMVRKDESWILPRFTYRCGSYTVDDCCRDLQQRLGIEEEDKTVFTVVAELLGSYDSNGFHGDGEGGYALLFMVEAHIDPVPIPDGYTWKDAAFLSTCLENLDEKDQQNHIISDTLRYIGPDRDEALSNLTDPRYKFGWFSAVSDWLHSVMSSLGASPSGRLMQVHVIDSSTLLRKNSTKGWFYVKAPALGCMETAISVALTDLMPHRVVNTVASSPELRCFVTREFERSVPFEKRYSLDAIRTLAEIQLESIPHVEALRQAGCPDRSPRRISEMMQAWAEKECYASVFEERLETFHELLPKLQDLCARLAASKIPLTLVHGDYAEHNLTYRDASRSGYILFDWEFACISHPFCDMHVLDNEYFDDGDDTDEEENSLPEHVRNEYMGMFAMFCSDRAQLREEYSAALVLSKILQMSTAMDCLQKCDVQRNSVFKEFVRNLLDWTESRVQHLNT